MKKRYLTGCLFLWCAAYSQTQSLPQEETAAQKYAGMKAQPSNAAPLIYTNKKALKTKLQTPKPSDAAQIVPTPESARKKTGPVLRAVPITTK